MTFGAGIVKVRQVGAEALKVLLKEVSEDGVRKKPTLADMQFFLRAILFLFVEKRFKTSFGQRTGDFSINVTKVIRRTCTVN